MADRAALRARESVCRGHRTRRGPFARGFTEGEWALLRKLADGLERSVGWTIPAAQRLRFLLDVGYATGLRASELVSATLGQIRVDGHDDHWLDLVGKGGRPAQVALPPLARAALDRYLVERRLPITSVRWAPRTPLVARLDDEGAGITGQRLWGVLRRFFRQAAVVVEADSPALADKLRCASCEASIGYIDGSFGLSLGDWKSPNTQPSRNSAE